MQFPLNGRKDLSLLGDRLETKNENKHSQEKNHNYDPEKGILVKPLS
jgi:hypothetical protein